MTNGPDATNDLIARLAAAPRPARLTATVLFAAVGLAVLAAGGLYLWSMGFRPGLAAAMAHPVTAAKIALPALLAALALPVVLRLSDPVGRPRPHWLLLPAGIAVALAAYAATTVPAGTLGAAIMGGTSVKCVTAIVQISALPMIAGLVILRRGASTRPALSGAVLGLLAGAGATAAYALSCAEDSPLFFVTWYGAAILCVTALGGLIGARALRW
jgi:hypothetical protein